jgi:CHAT domain-containing protein
VARIILGLGVLLTVCILTRPSSAIQAGSPDSSRWWETKDFADLSQTARERRAAGDFVGLESVYAAGYRRAQTLENLEAQTGYLGNLGTARMLLLHYASALEAYLAAEALAEQRGDWSALGGIAVNLSRVYMRMGDAEAALSALERGMAALNHLDHNGQRAPLPYKAQLLMSLRKVRAELQENPSGQPYLEPRYQDAIEAARQTGDVEAEAAAWEFLGQEQIAAGDLVSAEASLGQALRLRCSHSPRSLGFSYAALGALRLAQADHAGREERSRLAKEADAFTQSAIRLGSPGPAMYVLLHQRGQIREALGQPERALEDFGTAMKKAIQWNGAVPAAVSLVTGANVAMQREIFDSFVDAAAREALRSGNRHWAADALMALEANRAASLRENRELAPVWKKRLPAAYWETLGRLNKEEARNLSTDGTISPESKRLHLELTEMESAAGAGVSVMLAENFRTRNSLIHFQQGLGESDLLLSFYLGKRESYLWTVSRSRIELHRLPAESGIREDVARFRQAILTGAPAGEKLGADLYRRLFESLSPAEQAKRSWLLSLDGVLFDLPFAALVTNYYDGDPVYVAEHHSIQRIPGALLLTGHTARPGGYLGVADAVYNSADPRQTRDPKWTPNGTTGRGQLNRLVSSASEVQRSSESWQSETARSGPIQILEGTAARREAFLAALNASPSTIHLATHVLSSTTRPGQAFLAFSLDANGNPGLLSTSEIGMLHVPGALIVMTGCATGTGDVRAGAGLLGLTRAWMMAGARAVVATNWPVPDANGDLIPGFYRNLETDSAAEALRRSQVEQIHSGTWQAAPSYWAAFQVTGGGR